jgi:hypothetical protein
MLVLTHHFLITVITKPEVAEHLIPNIKNFKMIYYIREDFKGGRPGDVSEKDIVKIEMFCDRVSYLEIMEYIKKYYVKDYGVVCYLQEASVSM